MKPQLYPARLPMLRVPVSLKDRMERLAQHRQVKLSELHRSILQTYVDNVEKPIPLKEKVR